ncbi:MAG: hypothetical protein WA807_13980 [Steroidobacteraceae bacterium]
MVNSPLYRTSLVASFVIAAFAVALAAPSPKEFPLPGHGALTLRVPEGWTAEMKPPGTQLPPTITLAPWNGPKFVMSVTAEWPMASAQTLPDDNAIRSDVAAAARSAQSQSVEGVLPLQEITGVDGRGFYFTATDRAPKPNEAKYLTQGIIRVGEISLAFTVLTNDGQETVVRAALEMLRTAVHRQNGR